jgi:uncharacterized membrane protein
MAGDSHGGREASDTRTFGQRLADAVARGVGSWGFVIVETLFVLCWIAINLIAWTRHWDPYPFILLNLVFSILAAYTAPIVMMSQNRQDERDRDRAQADYQTNVESHTEIELLQATLTRIEAEQLHHIISLLERPSDRAHDRAGETEAEQGGDSERRA